MSYESVFISLDYNYWLIYDSGIFLLFHVELILNFDWTTVHYYWLFRYQIMKIERDVAKKCFFFVFHIWLKQFSIEYLLWPAGQLH